MRAYQLLFAPLSFLVLQAWVFPEGRGAHFIRNFLRGAAMGLAGYALTRLAAPLVPRAYGSFLAVFRLWIEGVLLPFGLAVLARRAFAPWDAVERSSREYRDFLAYLAGWFSIFGAIEAFSAFGRPSLLLDLAEPLLRFGLSLGLVWALREAPSRYGWELVGFLGLALLSSFAAASVLYLFVAGLELPAFIALAAACGGSGYLGIRGALEGARAERGVEPLDLSN
ncbi:MAG: hypothetical protein JXA15_13190 [Spirochaetales bacterium]|nr:hypothetical protein [Spirochaetales bacterium]